MPAPNTLFEYSSTALPTTEPDRPSAWYERRFGSIRIGDAAVLLATYWSAATLYSLTLFLNRLGQQDPEDHFFDAESYMQTGGLQYTVHFLLTLPIWFLVFRVLKGKPLWMRLLLHLVLLPTWVAFGRIAYYALSDAFDLFHLQGTGAIWDLYIPGLFYILQFGLMHGYEYWNDVQEKTRNEHALRVAALRSELSAIKAQLNPHFLYNVFNTINASIPSELEDTREMVAGLSDLFRYQLRASREERVPLRDELEFVKGYLELEKRRFEERLVVHIDVPVAVLDHPVPPMLLQPLVENAVKHGISSLVDGGEVRLEVKPMPQTNATSQNGPDGPKLLFRISDTGVGVEDKEAILDKGVGLRNTRLRLMKGFNAELELLDNQPRGLTVQFAL